MLQLIATSFFEHLPDPEITRTVLFDFPFSRQPLIVSPDPTAAYEIALAAPTAKSAGTTMRSDLMAEHRNAVRHHGASATPAAPHTRTEHAARPLSPPAAARS